IIMVICYLVASPLLLNFAFSKNFNVLAASVGGFALVVGMGYVNAQPLLCELLPERSRSTAIGFMNMASCFAGGTGVLLAGALKSTFGLANSFASLAVVQASVALMLLVTFLTVLPKDLMRRKA